MELGWRILISVSWRLLTRSSLTDRPKKTYVLSSPANINKRTDKTSSPQKNHIRTSYPRNMRQLQWHPTFSSKPKRLEGVQTWRSDRLALTGLWVPVLCTSYSRTLQASQFLIIRHYLSRRPITLVTLICTLPMSPQRVLEAPLSITWVNLVAGTLLATMVPAGEGWGRSGMEEFTRRKNAIDSSQPQMKEQGPRTQSCQPSNHPIMMTTPQTRTPLRILRHQLMTSPLPHSRTPLRILRHRLTSPLPHSRTLLTSSIMTSQTWQRKSTRRMRSMQMSPPYRRIQILQPLKNVQVRDRRSLLPKLRAMIVEHLVGSIILRDRFK